MMISDAENKFYQKKLIIWFGSAFGLLILFEVVLYAVMNSLGEV